MRTFCYLQLRYGDTSDFARFYRGHVSPSSSLISPSSRSGSKTPFSSLLLSKPLFGFALALMETSPATSARLARAFHASYSVFRSALKAKATSRSSSAIGAGTSPVLSVSRILPAPPVSPLSSVSGSSPPVVSVGSAGFSGSALGRMRKPESKSISSSVTVLSKAIRLLSIW